MIEENERAAKFMQAIQRDGEKRRTAIIQAIDEEIAAELEKVKTAAEAKARQMGDYEKVRLQEETNRKLSHSVVETGAELAARRSEIAQEVFDACEERLAAFILNLSQRFEQRGYSRSEFVLRMTRAEIGSYLGLKLETVSRVLSRFSHDNLIIVNQKHVQILDFDGLRAIVSGQTFFDNHSAQVKNDMKIHKTARGIDDLVAPSE